MKNPERARGGEQPPPAVPEDVLAEESPHAAIHQQQEKYGIGVDGGNAGLGEVHEVKGKEEGSHGAQPGFAQKLLCQRVEHWQHQNPEQRPHKAPAKGVHAKKGDPQGDDVFA